MLSFPGSLNICCRFCSITPNDMMYVCVMYAQVGGLDRLTLDSLYDRAANENKSQHMEPVTSSPCKNAQSS